ncbi:hypothetical protein OHAE_4481 [Ochrobactrum soli]|uniref:Uncharacterized protein n=1 Tax=Ochrobactrum soli TaxID=2448455 RepID=A0A2P9HC58_9HYPH|nr:hypothetical protein OHAE_4481 [[Ochrobactrum] soli]
MDMLTVSEQAPAHVRYPNWLSRQGLHGGRSQRHNKLRVDQFDLLLEPPATRLNMAGRRALMEPFLAPLNMSEMFDRVGEIATIA